MPRFASEEGGRGMSGHLPALLSFWVSAFRKAPSSCRAGVALAKGSPGPVSAAAVNALQFLPLPVKSKPGWSGGVLVTPTVPESVSTPIGIYAAGALALLGIAALNLWKLWRSGSYPAPSPFPNYDYRYLEQKYGAACSDVKHKRGMAPGSQRAPDRTSPIRKASLRADDTFESINELGSLELMSKDLGLAPYGPLKKSISADSLSSISSIGNNFGQDFTVGQVEVSMEYDGKAATLHVTLLQGKDLLEKEDARFESCFMRITKVSVVPFIRRPQSSLSAAASPGQSPPSPRQIQRSAYAVAFDERFSIPLDPAALEENSLRFSVFGIDEDERNVSTGVAELKLSDLDLATRPFNAWLYLQDMNKAVDTVGEILLSLSYLPTAERLTVVVVKAKNLVWTNGKVTADPFVKVYLLQDGRKISKKKTAVKRDDTNPVFNEAMIFSVPAIVLQVCPGSGGRREGKNVLFGSCGLLAQARANPGSPD
ncbi:synaptotagmin-12 [Egretta garzetta]|uniref:synaptotagmin-12 n=1 Tax=Egretta garzetta TaxID=188379 RepID=UPI00163BAEC8|nr:synaptotagmin-12 [Egretta garzetta]